MRSFKRVLKHMHSNESKNAGFQGIVIKISCVLTSFKCRVLRSQKMHAVVRVLKCRVLRSQEMHAF